MTNRYTVLQQTETNMTVTSGTELSRVCFYENIKSFLFHRSDRRCVGNPNVKQCGNLTLTNCVGYVRFLFHERHVRNVFELFISFVIALKPERLLVSLVLPV